MQYFISENTNKRTTDLSMVGSSRISNTKNKFQFDLHNKQVYTDKKFNHVFPKVEVHNKETTNFYCIFCLGILFYFSKYIWTKVNAGILTKIYL